MLTYVSKQFFGSGLLTGLSEVVNSPEPGNSNMLQKDSLGSWPRMFIFFLSPTNNSWHTCPCTCKSRTNAVVSRERQFIGCFPVTDSEGEEQLDRYIWKYSMFLSFFPFAQFLLYKMMQSWCTVLYKHEISYTQMLRNNIIFLLVYTQKRRRLTKSFTNTTVANTITSTNNVHLPKGYSPTV